MCELFGFSAAKETDVGEYLRTFFSHSDKHPHGWGLMYGSDHRIIKGAEQASQSIMLRRVTETLSPQRSVLAHIRYATVGSIKPENCHPFSGEDITGRVWTMIHNGTIYSGGQTYRYLNSQTGDTDSERLFLAFLDRMNRSLVRGNDSERERFRVVSGFIAENAPRNKLNLMIFDGELLYVHKNMKNTLSFKMTENGVVISTGPLDGDEWLPFPMAQVIAYKDGTEVFRGDRHKGIFIPNLEYITALDAMNI